MNDDSGPDDVPSAGEQPDDPTRPVDAPEPTTPLPAPAGPVWGAAVPTPEASADSDVPEYSQQDLLPQEVKPSRSHTALYIAIAAAVVLALVAVGVFLVASKDGGDRQAYCDKLRSVTSDGDVVSALQQGDLSALQDLADVAPSAVSDDWNTVIKLIDSAQNSGQPDMADLLAAASALKGIASDASSECDINIKVPSLG